MPFASTKPDVMSLPMAARSLGVSWTRAWTMALKGQLDGAEQVAGRWVVPRASVERMQQSALGRED